MPIPTFTTAPQWLQVPANSAPYFTGNTVTLDNILQNYGPFTHGGDTYFLVLESTDPFGPHPITAYKSTDGLTSQPLTRITSPFTTRQSGDTLFGTYWDGSSAIVYLAWVTQGKNVYTSSFNLSTGAFGGLNDTGIVLASFPGSLGIWVPSNGNIYVLWDYSDPSWSMNAVAYDGATWGTTITSAVTQQLLSVSVIASDSLGILSGNIYSLAAPGETPTPIAYSVFDGTVFTLKISSTVATYISGTGHNPSLYDSAHDKFVGVLADNTSNGFDAINICTYTVSPADGSGGTITRTVAFNDPADDYEFQTFALIADSTFSNFYLYANSAGTGHERQIQGFSATSPTGTWVGPTLAYDNDTDNSSPAGNLDPLTQIISPFEVVALADGRTSLLMGWFAADSGEESAVALFASSTPSIACPVASGTAVIGVPFTSSAPVVTGGTPPDTFALVSGPAWMSIDTETGVVSGIPTATGVVTYVIEVTDSLGNVASTAPGCTLSVRTPAKITRPLSILTAKQWSELREKGLLGLPTDIYLDHEFPNAGFHLWPIPSHAHQIEFFYWAVLPQFETPDEALDLPEGYYDMLVWSLAVALCGVYRRPVPGSVLALAKNARKVVEEVNAQLLAGSYHSSRTLSGPNEGEIKPHALDPVEPNLLPGATEK